MTYELQFGDLLPYWKVIAEGLLFTVVLTLVSTVAGVAVGAGVTRFEASFEGFAPQFLGF